MFSFDPVALARRQLAADEDRTARYEHLLARKVGRMVASPLALLRGTAPMFYSLLERHPILSDGPGGEGWLVGDAHLENFGAYRAGALTLHEARREQIVFDLNDFDDAFVGPWRIDVLRLLTSILLGGREIGADGQRAVCLCEALVDAYVDAAFEQGRAPPQPRAVRSLVEGVGARTRRQLLEGRTRVDGGERRFVLGGRYLALPPKLRVRAERAFAKYARRLPDAERPPEHALDVIDVAFRVAGTGSLGCLRLAVLVRGKGGEDGAWIFDMKEEGEPSASGFWRMPRLEPAERVMTAIGECLAKPPRMIGTTRLRGSSMFVRRLAPQEDRLDLAGLQADDLEPTARHLGALLGAAHLRGRSRAPKKPWGVADRAHLVASAIALAGIHEAVYLAYCGVARRLGGPAAPGGGGGSPSRASQRGA